MSSKDSILASIRHHTGTRHEMPELTLEAITYADKLATFSEVLAGAGGKAIELKPGEDVNEVIRREFPEAKRIASNLKEITCATFNPDELTDPRELNGTDVSVVEGSFGVAENAAVWLPRQVRYKGLYFISNALVILLDKTQLVHTMNEAYRRTATMDYDYGVFMSGPSKTADIEQALVFGAHGPIQVVVLSASRFCRSACTFLSIWRINPCSCRLSFAFRATRLSVCSDRRRLCARCLAIMSRSRERSIVVVTVGFGFSFLPNMPRNLFRFGFCGCSCTLFCTITGT